MATVHTIAPCLWFDTQAEEAALYYVGIFKQSKLGRISRYGKAGYETHHKLAGSVLTVEFELNGMAFTALNGGPDFRFNEAVSFLVYCDTQPEIDYYWNELSKGGDPKAQQCGWLKDKYGVSWQIVPAVLGDLMSKSAESSERVMAALLPMKKLDIATLQRAAS